MMRDEFDAACKRVDSNYDARKVTDAMYRQIEFVYTWYPSLPESGAKDIIAYIYTHLGMSAIRDMEARATAAKRLTDEISTVQRKQADLIKALELLKGGCYANSFDEYY